LFNGCLFFAAASRARTFAQVVRKIQIFLTPKSRNASPDNRFGSSQKRKKAFCLKPLQGFRFRHLLIRKIQIFLTGGRGRICKMPRSKFNPQNSTRKIQRTKFNAQNTTHKIQRTKFNAQDSTRKIQRARF